MEEDRLPPICSKRIRILCQTVLIVTCLIFLTGKGVFGEASARGGSGRTQVLFARNMQGNEMTENTKLYETIFKRKSIREYDLTPLDEPRLAGIMAHVSALKPLYDGIKIDIKLLSQRDVKGLFLAKAPHYLAVFSEAQDGYLTNVGFLLQQMDLFLSANGLGSCWQGMPKPTKEILNKSKLEFVILLALGEPRERLHRESISEFKRRPLGEITGIKGADELLEPARLAPSAMNRQQWFFTGSADTIHAYRTKSSFLTAFMFERMNKISIGIALCHLWIAGEHFGKEVEFVRDQEAKSHPPAGCDYVITLKMK